MSQPLFDAPGRPEESLPRRLSFAGMNEDATGDQGESALGGGRVDDDDDDDDEPVFLSVHLDLLRALYRDQPAPVEDSNALFEAIPRFLAARPGLVRGRAEARRLEGVHNEAVRVVSAGRARAQAAGSGSDGGRPRKRHKSLSPGRSPGPAAVPSPLLFGAVPGSGPDAEPFALVARCLRLRAEAGRRRLRAAVDPFRPLHRAVRGELRRLEGRVAAARADRTAAARAALETLLSTSSPLDKPTGGDPEETDTPGTAAGDAAQDAQQLSEIARATYQMRLWRLLARDMERIVAD